MLFVTGLSGSGKTTLCKKLSRKYNATCISLDALRHYSSAAGESRKAVNKFIRIFPNIIDYINSNWTGYEDFFTKYMQLFIAFLFFEAQKQKRLYIVEGIQLFVRLPKEALICCPRVIRGTSSIHSYKSAFMRDKPISIWNRIFRFIRYSVLHYFKLNHYLCYWSKYEKKIKYSPKPGIN